MNTHIFTSCTNNYLPLARVLMESIKRFHPEIYTHLLLCDSLDKTINQDNFDYIVTVKDLNIPNLSQWLFKHSVVELCTAVKGLGFKHIMANYDCDYIFYFDPDIAIFSSLDKLISNFEDSDILLTPHQLQPETISSAVMDNEISFLRHGSFNLGFLGVKNSSQGKKFLDWWANRCLEYCYADYLYGLYTDQRWLDLAPSFFTGIKILRNPEYNVASWNLTHRHLQGNIKNKILVNNEPLCFYHFSRSQAILLDKYNLHNETTLSLTKWYQEKCEEMGKNELEKIACVYNYFDNGTIIPDEARKLYRQVPELEEKYRHPFGEEFCNWYISHKKYLEEQDINYLKKELNNCRIDLENNQEELAILQEKLADYRELVRWMESSKFWKIRLQWIKVKTFLIKLNGMLMSIRELINRSINSLITIVKKPILELTNIRLNWHKLLIIPQHPPQNLELPESYFKTNLLNSDLDNFPKISIVTPSYNQGHFIEDTIKSILEQNYPNLEYIIQDGNSQDNSIDIIKKYGNGLQFYSQIDRGQGEAINKGFSHSTGEIMAWVNSDDLLLPTSLFYVADYFNRHPKVDVIYGDRIIINEHNQETGKWILPPHDDNMLIWADYVPQETMFWRRGIWEKVGGYIDESFQFVIDWDLILRFRKVGAVFRHLPRFLAAFRVHQQQKTQSWFTIGEEEMGILRHQCHGYTPSVVEANEKIKNYVLRSLFHYQLHSMNKAINKKFFKNYQNFSLTKKTENTDTIEKV